LQQERLNVANKMADKKKQASQGSQVSTRSRATELAKKQGSGKAAGGTGAKEVARADAKEVKEVAVGSSAAVSAGASASASAKAVAREERKERQKAESKPVRRESKGPSTLETRIRNNRIGRFMLEAYYELRHKVTWPTFEEARNMTFVVIGLSVAVGAVLGLADYGLQQLFLLIGK
jgi:preprotein translocase SecE subunit